MKKILAFFMAAFFSLMALGCTGEQAATQAKGAQEKGQGSLIVKMLDIGQGDALLIKTAKETILLDSGDVDKRDDIVKLLKKENVKAIDKLIITHPHADHLGGAYAVLKNFTVKSVYDNGQATTNKTYTTYLKLIKEQNIPYKSLRAGDKIDFGGSVQFEVLNPTDAEVKKGGDINSNSIVGLLTYGKFAMLTTGDCEASREKEILKNTAND
jgi:competence protein ComEC